MLGLFPKLFLDFLEHETSSYEKYMIMVSSFSQTGALLPLQLKSTNRGSRPIGIFRHLVALDTRQQRIPCSMGAQAQGHQ